MPRRLPFFAQSPSTDDRAVFPCERRDLIPKLGEPFSLDHGSGEYGEPDDIEDENCFQVAFLGCP